jgi:Type II CAAX prenyl endopeptidase Rce1-like
VAKPPQALKPVDGEDIVARTASGPWTDLGLTLPLFITYHLGVAFLPVRNAADWVTQQLVSLADHNAQLYTLLTLSIATVYVGVLVIAGWGQALKASAFAWLMVEAAVYASAMRATASYLTAKITLGPGSADSVFSGLVLSVGAGFYEELAFRVGLFAGGFKLLQLLFAFVPWQRVLVACGWALVTSCLFSLWHYIGPLGDALELKSFVFRAVCGVIFTIIYTFRGFAPVVWTHALYDIWVLVL